MTKRCLQIPKPFIIWPLFPDPYSLALPRSPLPEISVL